MAKSLKVETLVVEITEQIDAYFANFPDASDRRRGNKMARERMTILYDLSAAKPALVLGTSNKTELLLGYGTLYGDMASAVNPIGDLYKTQVWGIAEHLGLPKSVIRKAPTADLCAGPDRRGRARLQLSRRRPVALLDDRRALHADELMAAGFDAAFVERVRELVQASQFKRRLPVIAKVSRRTIDTDFRYPRDWGR